MGEENFRLNGFHCCINNFESLFIQLRGNKRHKTETSYLFLITFRDSPSCWQRLSSFITHEFNYINSLEETLLYKADFWYNPYFLFLNFYLINKWWIISNKTKHNLDNCHVKLPCFLLCSRAKTKESRYYFLYFVPAINFYK